MENGFLRNIDFIYSVLEYFQFLEKIGYRITMVKTIGPSCLITYNSFKFKREISFSQSILEGSIVHGNNYYVLIRKHKESLLKMFGSAIQYLNPKYLNSYGDNWNVPIGITSENYQVVLSTYADFFNAEIDSILRGEEWFKD